MPFFLRSSTNSTSRQSLLSYGSTTDGGDTISHYTYFDSEEPYGFDDFEELSSSGRYQHHPTIRKLEHCRRGFVSLILVLTFLVILFGVTSVDPDFNAALCQTFLVFLKSGAKS